jgi:hypothetical protein
MYSCDVQSRTASHLSETRVRCGVELVIEKLVHGKSGWKRQASVSFVDESRDEEFLSLVKPLCAVVNSCAGARIAGSGGRKEGKKRETSLLQREEEDEEEEEGEF